MHVWRPLAIGGAAFGILAIFLPFARYPVIGTIDGISGDAWPAVAVIGPVVAKALVGDWTRGNGVALGVSAIALSCASVLFAVVKLADAATSVRDTAGASLGPGAPVLVAAACVVLTGAALSLRRA